MNDVERCLLEQSNTDLFHQVVNDSFSYADHLIDERDLNKLNKEGNK